MNATAGRRQLGIGVERNMGNFYKSIYSDRELASNTCSITVNA